MNTRREDCDRYAGQAKVDTSESKVAGRNLSIDIQEVSFTTASRVLVQSRTVGIIIIIVIMV